MKKYIIYILVFFSAIDLFSQIKKRDVIISVNGNYMKIITESGVTSNDIYIEGQYSNIGSSLGYCITDKFIVGIGLDYNWEKETRTNMLYFNQFAQIEQMNIESKTLLPNLYLGYYYQIINKVYFNANLNLSYGNVKSYYNTFLTGIDSISSTYEYINEFESNYEFIAAKISPELTYFFSTSFSSFIGLGGIEFSLIDREFDNSSWGINFNPNHWIFGIKIKI